MKPLIEALNHIQTYAPANHAGTTNRRLVSREDCGHFEMIHGTIEPGGLAERHAHDVEYQAVFVLGGSASVELGDDPAKIIGAGSIVRIPPGTQHFVKSLGPEPLQLLIVYSPPLGSVPAAESGA